VGRVDSYGVTDRVMIETKIGKIIACQPADVKGEQIDLIVEKFLDDHPERLNYSAASLIGKAIGAYFPCK